MTQPTLRYFGVAVLVRSGDSLLLQRKTPGYPLADYVGRHTLIGGFWSTDRDQSPRETMRREVREEIRPDELCRAVDEGLEFFAGLDYRLPELDDEGEPFWTRAYVYEVDIRGRFDLAKAELLEGEAVYVEHIAGFQGRFCWGHDHTLSRWGDRRETAEVGTPEGGTETSRIATLEEPGAYTEIDRTNLLHDPTRDHPRSEFMED